MGHSFRKSALHITVASWALTSKNVIYFQVFESDIETRLLCWVLSVFFREFDHEPLPKIQFRPLGVSLFIITLRFSLRLWCRELGILLLLWQSQKVWWAPNFLMAQCWKIPCPSKRKIHLHPHQCSRIKVQKRKGEQKTKKGDIFLHSIPRLPGRKGARHIKVCLCF